MSNGNSLEIELAPELLQLGEVAGFLRLKLVTTRAPSLGSATTQQKTPLVVETGWFSDPLGADGLGGLPNRLEPLLQLLEDVGFLGAPEDEPGNAKQVEPASAGSAIQWHPILDPTPTTVSTGAEDTPKTIGLYVVHESNAATGSVLGLGFRHAFSSNGISLSRMPSCR